MWLWESELRELGFRRKAERCCYRRTNLPPDASEPVARVRVLFAPFALQRVRILYGPFTAARSSAACSAVAPRAHTPGK